MWLVLLCNVGLLACDGPERRILLGPLPPRSRDAASEDAGIDIPAGAVPCGDESDCDDTVDCTTDLCLAQGYCQSINSGERCSDGVFCNGFEVCNATLGCVAGAAPSCDDQDACTVDSCQEDQKACVHGARDFDRDGEIDQHCAGGTDCDDFDETRGARAAEVCGDVADNDCDGTVDEQSCGRADHDSCDDALDVSAGGTFLVDLAGAVADYTLSCEPNAAREVVFSFELSKPRNVKLVASGVLAGGGEEIAALALQTQCGELASERECKRGFPGDLRVRALPAGRYFVVASSFGARSLKLSVSFDAPSPALTNTSCASAIDVSAGGRWTGSFVDVTDGVRSSCGVDGQPDLYYALTLTAQSDLELAAISSEGAPLTFSVRKGCSKKAAELRCESSAPAQARMHQLDAGSYVIVLEGPSSREVPFALDVAVLPPTPPPAGDGCAHPLKLVLDEKQAITLRDKQTAVATSCGPALAGAVLSLHVPRPMDLAVEADAGDAFVRFALQTQCGAASSDLFCRGAAPLDTRVRDLASGDYFVVVSAPAAQSLALQVKSLPRTRPVAVRSNASCALAFDIPIEGGLFSGDTSTLRDDYQAPCGGHAASSDSVFRLVLTEPRHVVAAIDSGFDSVLYRIHDEASADAPCVDIEPAACDDDSGEGSQAQLDEQLEPGTYYYVVDGFKSTNAGAYLLDVSVTND